MSAPPSPSSRQGAFDQSSSNYPSYPNHRPSSSRQSSTSSLHSIKRKPVPTEIDQLKQLGNEVLGNGNAQRDADKEEEVLNGEHDLSSSVLKAS